MRTSQPCNSGQFRIGHGRCIHSHQSTRDKVDQIFYCREVAGLVAGLVRECVHLISSDLFGRPTWSSTAGRNAGECSKTHDAHPSPFLILQDEPASCSDAPTRPPRPKSAIPFRPFRLPSLVSLFVFVSSFVSNRRQSPPCAGRQLHPAVGREGRAAARRPRGDQRARRHLRSVAQQGLGGA
jgi:hypothetical protein